MARIYLILVQAIFLFGATKSQSSTDSVSASVSASFSTSASVSMSLSASTSVSNSVSPSASFSTSVGPSMSVSMSPSTSTSVSTSASPSTSVSTSVGPSTSVSMSPSTSTSVSTSASPSTSVSTSVGPSTSVSMSPSTSTSVSTSASPSTSVSTSVGPSTSVSMSPSTSTSVSTSPSPSTSVSTSVGPSTSVSMSPSASTSVSTSASPSTSVSTSVGPSTSTSVKISPSSTTGVSSSIAPVTPGSVVNIVLNMTRSCNVNGYNSSSDAEYVFNSLDTALKDLFTRDSITYAIKVLYVSATCDSGTNVQITIRVTFRTNLPSDLVIEQMLQGAIDNNIANLNIIGQTVTFQGADVVYEAKSGECQKCCNAGGPITLIQSCTPTSNCEGFLRKEKTESGHCPGEGKDTCQSVVCDKAFSLHSPSFAVLAVMTLVSLFRITVC